MRSRQVLLEARKATRKSLYGSCQDTEVKKESRVYRGGPWGKGDFPGIFVSKDMASAEQYGELTVFELDDSLNILVSGSEEAKNLVKRFEIWEPENEGFWNDDPMIELFMLPNEGWVWFLKQKGYDGTSLGRDIFLFSDKGLRKIEEKQI